MGDPIPDPHQDQHPRQEHWRRRPVGDRMVEHGSPGSIQYPATGPQGRPICQKPIERDDHRLIAPEEIRLRPMMDREVEDRIRAEDISWDINDRGYHWRHWSEHELCHHFDGSYHRWGFYFRDVYTWTVYYNDCFWWYDPYRHRWCYLYDWTWWWRDHDNALFRYRDGEYHRCDGEPSPCGDRRECEPEKPVPPPTALQAVYTSNPLDRNKHRIKLTWSAVAAIPEIVLYEVWRNEHRIGCVRACERLEFCDDSVGGGVEFFPDYYTYFVTSMDRSGRCSAPSESICNFSPQAERYIVNLRALLKDNPPDPRVRRWSDDDLWLAISMGLSRVNAIPMVTDFNLETAPKDFFNYILVAARLAALRSQAALEAAKEFNLGAGGTTISINRTMLYNNMVQAEESAFATELKSIKLYCTMRFVHGEGILTSPLSFRIRTYAPRQYRIR